jgi:hypothetical protein
MRRVACLALALAAAVEGYSFCPATFTSLSSRTATARPLRAASLARPRTVLRMSAAFAAADFSEGMCV